MMITTQTPANFSKLIARRLDLNARGNGTRESRQIIRDGHISWLSDIAEIVSDDYPRNPGFRASDRRGETRVRITLQPTDILIAWDTPLRDYRASGLASLSAGRVVRSDEGALKIAWNGDAGLDASRKGEHGIVVRDTTTDAIVVEITT